jgi:sulfonate transport system substrate-binding protein
LKLSLSTRKSLGLAIGISSLALAATGAATASAATSAATNPAFTPANPATSLGGITLGVGDQAGTGAEAVLEAAGLYNSSTGKLKDGLKVSFADFTNGPAILEGIEGGSLQIGGVGDAPPVFADPTNNLVIVGTLKSSYSNAALLVKAGSGINTIGQLAGKTIGVGTGTSADYHLLTVLLDNGLQPTSVNRTSVSGASCVSELNAGEIAACDTWSPFVEEGEADGDVALYNGPPNGSPYSYQVASATALKNPKYVLAIRDYLTELDAGYTFVSKHPVLWAQAWASVTGLPLDVMKAATLDDPYVPIPVTSTVVTQEQDVVKAFATAGEIPASYNIAKYVTSAFSDSVTGDWSTTTTTTTTKKKKK